MSDEGRETVRRLRQMMTDHGAEMSSEEFWTLSDAAFAIEALGDVAPACPSGVCHTMFEREADGRVIATVEASAYGSTEADAEQAAYRLIATAACPGPSELHHDCHDLVCNASRNHPRGAQGVGCSCRSREVRASAASPGPSRAVANLIADFVLAIDWNTKTLRLDQAHRAIEEYDSAAASRVEPLIAPLIARLIETAGDAVCEWRLHGQLTDSCRHLEAAIAAITRGPVAVPLQAVEALIAQWRDVKPDAPGRSERWIAAHRKCADELAEALKGR